MNHFFLVLTPGLGPSMDFFLSRWQRENPDDVLLDVTSRSIANDALVLQISTDADMLHIFEEAKKVEAAVTGNTSNWSVRLYYRLEEESRAGIPSYFDLPPAHSWKKL